MKLREALIALINFEKIRCSAWSYSEYIYFKDNNIYDQNNSIVDYFTINQPNSSWEFYYEDKISFTFTFTEALHEMDINRGEVYECNEKDLYKIDYDGVIKRKVAPHITGESSEFNACGARINDLLKLKFRKVEK